MQVIFALVFAFKRVYTQLLLICDSSWATCIGATCSMGRLLCLVDNVFA